METTKSPVKAATTPDDLGVPVGELVVEISGNSAQPEKVRIRSPKCTIGSADACTIRLNSLGVHAVHCIILRGADCTYVRRWADSAWLNGQPFDDALLNVGDVLSFANIQIKVVADNRLTGEANLNDKMATAEFRVEQLSRQTQFLYERIRHLESDSSELSSTTQNELLVRLTRLQDEKQELERRIAAQSIRHLDERRQWGCDTERLKAELARLADHVPPADGSPSEDEIKRVQELEQQQQTLQVEQAAFATEMIRVQEEAAKLEEQSVATEQERQALECRAAELNERFATFESQQAELDARQTELDARQAELDARQGELDDRQVEFDSQLSGWDTQQGEWATQQAEFARQQAELLKQQNELKQQQADLQQQQAEVERQQADVQIRQAELERQQTERNTELAQATVELEQAREIAAEEQRRAFQLRTEIAELEARCDELQQEIARRNSLISDRLPPPLRNNGDDVPAPDSSAADRPQLSGPDDQQPFVEQPSSPSADDLMSYASQVAQEVSSQVIDQQAEPLDQQPTAHDSSPFDSHFIDLEGSTSEPAISPLETSTDNDHQPTYQEPLDETVSPHESHFIDLERSEMGAAVAADEPSAEVYDQSTGEEPLDKTVSLLESQFIELQDGETPAANAASEPSADEYGQPTSEELPDEAASPFASQFIDLEDGQTDAAVATSERSADECEKPTGEEQRHEPTSPSESQFIDLEDECRPTNEFDSEVPAADSIDKMGLKDDSEPVSPFESPFIDLDDDTGQEMTLPQQPASDVEPDPVAGTEPTLAEADHDPLSLTTSQFIELETDAMGDVAAQLQPAADLPRASIDDLPAPLVDDGFTDEVAFDQPASPFESQFIDLEVADAEECTSESMSSAEAELAPLTAADSEPNVVEQLADPASLTTSQFIELEEDRLGHDRSAWDPVTDPARSVSPPDGEQEEEPDTESCLFESQFIELEDAAVEQVADELPGNASTELDEQTVADQAFPSDLFPDGPLAADAVVPSVDSANAFRSRLTVSDSFESESATPIDAPKVSAEGESSQFADIIDDEVEAALDANVEELLSATRSGRLLSESEYQADAADDMQFEQSPELSSTAADDMLSRIQAVIETETGQPPPAIDELADDPWVTEQGATNGPSTAEQGSDQHALLDELAHDPFTQAPADQYEFTGQQDSANDGQVSFEAEDFEQAGAAEWDQPREEEAAVGEVAAGESEDEAHVPTTPEEVSYQSVEREDPGLQTASLLEQFGIQNDVDYNPDPIPPVETELAVAVEDASASDLPADDSIENYMQQLLQRAGVDSTASQVGADTAAQPTDEVQSTNEAPAVPPIQQPRTKRTPSRNVVAVDNLAAMRELANESARSAINRHAHTSNRASIFTNSCIVAIAALLAAIFFVLAHGQMGMWLLLSIAAALCAVCFGYKTVIAYLTNRKNSPGERSAPTESQPEDEADAFDPANGLDQPHSNAAGGLAPLPQMLAEPQLQPPDDISFASPQEHDDQPMDAFPGFGDLGQEAAAPQQPRQSEPAFEHAPFNPEAASPNPPFHQDPATQYPPFHPDAATEYPPELYPGSGLASPQDS